MKYHYEQLIPLYLFRMFFPPIRVNGNCAEYNEKNENQYKTESRHYFSPPLPKYNPKQNDNMKDNPIAIRQLIDNLRKNSPANAPARMILEKSKKTSDSFAFWFLVSFIIKGIVSRMTENVK